MDLILSEFLYFRYLYISDITQESKLHFFRIPKLGSYMAVPLNLYNYLTPECFDSALSTERIYNQRLAEYQKELDDLQQKTKEA
jgi:hypothetical protein